MGTSVQLTPLSGVYSESHLCYLLDVDGFRFLLDCGWDDRFNVQALQPLAAVAPTVDAVLLSHPDTLHLGALPYAMKKLGLTAPVYCTRPVNKMGLMYMYDHYLSRKAVSHFDLFNMDDIDSAFQNCVPMTYSQHLPLSGKGEGITITPYAAGHLLGGTIWKITKDTEDIIYAVDFNHRKERHLNGTVLESFVRPAVLITDAYNALNNQPVRRQRDQEFVDAIMKVLRTDGNVLLPVDTAGRALELILYLDQYWSVQGFNYPLVFLTYISVSTIEFAKSLLEWMSDAIAKSFEQSRENAFQLKCFQLCSSKKKLEALPAGPKVVFASMASLEAGFARELFVEWATDSKNLVLFTERGQFGTLARMLQSEPAPKVVKVSMSRKVPLTGDELKAYEEEQIRISKEAAENSIPQEEETKASQSAGPAGAPSDTNMSEASMKQSTSGSKSQLTSVAHLELAHQRHVFMDGFTLPPNSAPMFPYHEYTQDWDEYGEVINPDDFVMQEDEILDMSIVHISGGKDGDMKAEAETEEMLLSDKPSKVLADDILVQVRCSLQYMDFEGRSDGRSIKTILAHVVPLKLVLVHGSSEATENLKQHSLRHVSHVFAPKLGETVDVTSDLSAYKVRLTERLMSNVLFRKLGDYELAWVDGEVGPKEDDILPLLPHSGVPPPHKAVFVGDLKLADFKQLLASKRRSTASMASTSLGVDVLHSSFHAPFPLPLPLRVPSTVHSRPRSFHLRPRFPLRCQDDASPDVAQTASPPPAPVSTSNDSLSKAVKKTAATFAPRSSMKTKNPAVPGSTLYSVFEVQGYLSMAIGGLLSFNFVFPSSEPDIWRLMGMWSIWMFTIPSLRARDCSNKEKDALNYLFLGIPLINVLIPLVWRSFAVVWTADVLAFFAVYAWKLNWFSLGEKTDN